jgi:hypothetical protein
MKRGPGRLYLILASFVLIVSLGIYVSKGKPLDPVSPLEGSPQELESIAPIVATLPGASPSAPESPSPVPSPSPSPAPLEPTFVITSPKPDLKYRITQGSQTLVAIIPIQIGLVLPDPDETSDGEPTPLASPQTHAKATAVVRVSRQFKDDKPLLVMEKTVVVDAALPESFKFSAKTPGRYQIQVIPGKGSPIQAMFTVAPDFEAIELREPESFVDSGEVNELRRQKVRLSWKPYPGATSYRIQIFRGGKPFEEAEVNGTEYSVKRADILDSERRYRVAARLLDGWAVTSQEAPFVFDFMPPTLITPANSMELGEDDNLWDGNGILLSWQKSGISDGYILQIAEDPSFSKLIVKKRQPDNFLIFKPANRDVTYFWRVQAVANGAVSRSSAVFSFSVKRRASKSP